MSTPLLTLDTLIVRPVIQIDGARYELFSADELSVLDSHRFSVWGRRIDQLSQSERADDDTLFELASLYDSVARAAVVNVPEPVMEKLTGAQKIAIVDVFTGLLLRNKLGVAGAMAAAMGPETASLWTGEKSSLVSSDFSAATPTGGWRARLARWCGLI